MPPLKPTLAVVMVLLALGAVLWIGRGEPVELGEPLTPAELDAILALPPAPTARAKAEPAAKKPEPTAQDFAALDGDVRLLQHLHRRIGTRANAWRALPAAVRDLYMTLRLEEIARTDGFIVGLAAVAPGGDVTAAEAAEACERLGVGAAGEALRRLDALVERDGPRWQAALNPPDGVAPGPQPDSRELDRLQAAFALQVPAVRAARAAWIREHRAEVLAQ